MNTVFKLRAKCPLSGKICSKIISKICKKKKKTNGAELICLCKNL